MTQQTPTRWIVSPDRLIHSAFVTGLITLAEAESSKLKDAAREEADSLGESWPEEEGFGSSDIWGYVQSMLSCVGIKTDWRNNKLTRL
jgi:hypothetical protein